MRLLCVLSILIVSVLPRYADAQQVLWHPFDFNNGSPDCGFGCYDGHEGSDWNCDVGTPIYASISGTVIEVTNSVSGQTCTPSFGNKVTIENVAGDIRVITAHMQQNSIVVSVNSTVLAGDFIGRSSNTGYTLTQNQQGEWVCNSGGGEHLHLEVRAKISSTWSAVNPFTYNGGMWTNPLRFGSPHTYTCAYAGQTTKDANGYYNLHPGDEIELWVDFENTGTATWYNDPEAHPNDYVELKSCDSIGNVCNSWLYDSSLGWKNAQAPWTMNQSSRSNGQVARFEFTGKVPSNATLGLHKVYFRPNNSANGGTLMQDWGGMQFPVNVISSGLSSEEGFVPFAGYFNLDNKVDVGLWDKSNGDVYVALRDPSSNRFIYDDDPWLTGFGDPSVDQLLVGDYSGDGYDELCRYRASSGSWYVALNQYGSTGGFVSDGCWLSSWATAGIGGSNDWQPLTADYDGSGKDDICVYRPSDGRWVVAYNYSGDYFQQAGGVWLDDWGDGSYGTYWPFTGTINSGTKQDVGCYHPGTGKWFVATSNAPTTTFTSQGEWLNAWASGSSTTWKFFMGKCTDDALDDIIVYKPADGKWVVAKNYQTYFDQLNGNDEGGSWLIPWAVEDGDNWHALVGDVNGDSWTDLIVYSPVDGKWAVAYSNGGYSPPWFEQANGTDEGGSWLMNWGIENGGSGKLVGSDEQKILPTTLALQQNYPNPFNPMTVISYTLPTASDVSIDVFNVLGQRVETLVDTYQNAGEHTVIWNSGDYPSGVYFYRLAMNGSVETKKMILLK